MGSAHPADLHGIQPYFADRAAEVDAGGGDVRAGLRWLGSQGLLDGPANGSHDGLRSAVELVRLVAGGCLASGFALWSQLMVLEYLTRFPPSGEVRDELAGLRAGRVTGATALAPAIASLAGRAELPVVAEPDGDGWLLSGPVRWASNLFDDAVVVTPARTADGERIVAMIRLDAPGVRRHPPARLLALNGTGTGALELRGVAVGPGAVLGRDLVGFMSGCRPAMLLLQAALAVGVTDAAIEETAGRLGGVNAVLRGDHDQLTARQRQVSDDLLRLAQRPGQAARGEFAALRLAAIRLAAEAVRLEAAAGGGAGYRDGAATSRRVREAAFLPVQAPTEAQLRAEVEASQA
jgi:alkylation response protein AidB-like acyl-CoA dehydrogenase